MDRYETEGIIANALFGQVLLCTDRLTGDSVAIKRMDLHAASTKRIGTHCIAEDIGFEKQVNRILSANGGHPHILRLRDDFIQDGYDHFVFDYCRGGELFDLVDTMPTQRLDIESTRRYFGQIVHGLAFMHSRGIAHRDLSLENVLLDGKDNCYICDFGLASPISVKQRNAVGKAFYMAPEVAARMLYDPIKADIWSLGIMLFMLLSGSPLVEMACYEDSRFRYLQTHGLHELINAWQMDHVIYGHGADLLDRLLCVDPSSRITLDQIMFHPFMHDTSKKYSYNHGHGVSQLLRRRSTMKVV